jgi:alkylation response protein AidB-like acyl-CoA dehydrogenase
MDFEASEEQRAVLEAIDALLLRHAGAARAIALATTGAYDHELDEALVGSGFVDVGRSMSPLEAALVAEAVSKAGGRSAYAAAALVAPNVCDQTIDGPIAMAVAGEHGAVRFAAHARSLLVVDDGDARMIDLADCEIEPLASNFGYPMGYVTADVRSGGRRVGDGAQLENWWRVALAAETAGAMRSALDVTVEYLKNRRQFGRTIGSFQAVQHRLAECFVMVESARWLTYECAALGAPREAAATAATHALAAAARVFTEMHQLSGAIGFTHEHDLHVWSMRLHALRTELGGVAAHRRAISATRWA